MELSEILKIYRTSGQNKNKLEEELIIACVKVWDAVNCSDQDKLVDSFAYFELISDQFRQKNGLNMRIYNAKHRLQNVHIYKRSANS